MSLIRHFVLKSSVLPDFKVGLRRNRSFMTSYFKDKVVVVTGGTDGIGKALVEALLDQGAKVATCGRNHDKLYRLQSQYPSAHLHTMVADVSSENDCRRLIEMTIKNFGGIDILINNAGISMRALLKDVSIETIQKVMDTLDAIARTPLPPGLPSMQNALGSSVGAWRRVLRRLAIQREGHRVGWVVDRHDEV